MTHEDAIKDLTRIFREYPALILVKKIEAAILPNVPPNAVVLQLLTRDNTCG